MPPRASRFAQGDPLGSMLRRARHNHEPPLTQGDVADALDVTQSTVSAWESGRIRPSLGAVKVLAGVLGVQVDDLVTAAATGD